jgi:hypothetical protein
MNAMHTSVSSLFLVSNPGMLQLAPYSKVPSPPLLPSGRGGVADGVSSDGAGGREKRETGRAMSWSSLVSSGREEVQAFTQEG